MSCTRGGAYCANASLDAPSSIFPDLGHTRRVLLWVALGVGLACGLTVPRTPLAGGWVTVPGVLVRTRDVPLLVPGMRVKTAPGSGAVPRRLAPRAAGEMTAYNPSDATPVFVGPRSQEPRELKPKAVLLRELRDSISEASGGNQISWALNTMATTQWYRATMDGGDWWQTYAELERLCEALGDNADLFNADQILRTFDALLLLSAADDAIRDMLGRGMGSLLLHRSVLCGRSLRIGEGTPAPTSRPRRGRSEAWDGAWRTAEGWESSEGAWDEQRRVGPEMMWVAVWGPIRIQEAVVEGMATKKHNAEPVWLGCGQNKRSTCHCYCGGMAGGCTGVGATAWLPAVEAVGWLERTRCWHRRSTSECRSLRSPILFLFSKGLPGPPLHCPL